MKSSMRNISISVIFSFLLLLPNLVYSQAYDLDDNEIKRVQFIIRGGFNFSNINRVVVGQSGKESLKIGYNTGLLADVSLGEGLHIQSGLTITTKGARMKKVPLSGGGNTNLTMNTVYLQAPLLFAYKIPVGDYQSFNIALGPYYSYGISGDIRGKGFTKIDTFGDEGVCEKSDIGLSIEAQFEAPKYLIFCGAQTGFSQIMKKDRLPSSFQSKVRNYDFHFGVGYKF